MRWHKESITEGEVDALYKAAQRAWSDDTRFPIAEVLTADSGQCYVTAFWLRERLGGNIGRKKGHYAWISPDENYKIDLAPHTGHYVYDKNDGFTPVEPIPNGRTERFCKRANSIFDHLGKILRLSLDYMGDPLPASEPQRSSELAQETDQTAQYWHDEPNWKGAEGDFNFVYANGALEVSPFHNHEELLSHTGVSKSHTGPMAFGHIMLANNKATWEIDSNMNVKGLDRIFKDYTRHVGWDWGGITNIEGEPISDEFAPKKSNLLHFVYDTDKEHLYIGRDTPAGLAIRIGRLHEEERARELLSGRVAISGRRAYVSPIDHRVLRSLYDYSCDNGLILYAGNDNQMKVIPDLQEHNFYDPNPKNDNEHQYPASEPDYREPSGVYRCPVCSRLFPGWDEYSEHRRQEAEDAGEPREDGGFPEVKENPIQDAHFTPMQPEIFMAAVMPAERHEAERTPVWDGLDQPGDQYFVCYRNGSPVGYSRMRGGKLNVTAALSRPLAKGIEATIARYSQKEPKDLLSAPLPFIYDIQEDNITLGQPGQRTSDIPGKFTPGGIIEGIYEPGGKVIVKTLTNMPYSVRHVVDLWYYSHPELSVTAVYLQDASGKQTKLASKDVGGYISTLVAADPAAHASTKALEASGGKVYAVGGAVRDALLGKEPKDIDLMVTGLSPAEVKVALEELPGQTLTTGKDFGVFRYRDKGDDVEIALPRRERSTGAGHRDFDVQADPNMRPEEDLWRRDFSANAMAVDLSNGRLVDPYGGSQDIEKGILRAHNPESLSEDPLRVVRGLVANSRHGLVPDDVTKQRMAEAAPSIGHLAPERIQNELDKIFAGENPASAIRLAHETGALQSILPEVANTMGYDQNNPHHEFELGEHLLNTLGRASEKSQDPDVRLAALLHDIGKPGSQWTDPETGKSHFYKKRLEDGSFIGDNHEELGARMTNALMNRLRYPKDRTQRVTQLVEHHMFPAFTSEKGARRFLNRVGDHADDLMDLRWADQGGKSAYPNPAGEREGLTLDKQRELIDRVRQQSQPVSQRSLAINGNDLIALGIRPGPQMGIILNQLTDAVIDNPSLNQRDTLLNMAQNVS